MSQGWEVAHEGALVSAATYDSLVVHGQDDTDQMQGVHLESAGGGEPPAAGANKTAGLESEVDRAAERRELDGEKVKTLLSIKALAQDQQLAGDRRKASSSYLGTGRSAGQREAKDIRKLLNNLHQQAWRKSATTGNAEPLIRARRDVELCEAVQSDLALCVSSSRAPALLWSSMPPKNARRLGALDMMSQVLPESDLHHFHAIPVGQDLETLKRITYVEPVGHVSGVAFYAGTEGAPGSPMGLSHTIARKKVGDIHAETQVSPFLSATVHLPRDSEEFRKCRAMWPAASGIGSLGPTFGTSRSLFDIKEHGIQEAEMVPSDAYDVATLTKCTDFVSVEEVAAGHGISQTVDGLNTVSPQHFGIKTFSSHPGLSAETPAGIRSPERAGRPVGFDMMIEQTHPQQRSPRQHRRSLNLERGPHTHDDIHRMARSIASFRDVLPSTILDVTKNYQEFYPSHNSTTATARAVALPFIVSNCSLVAASNSKLPSVYYVGDGIVEAQDDAGAPKAKATQDAPTLPSLTSLAPPVFTVSGAAVPCSAVSDRQMASPPAGARGSGGGGGMLVRGSATPSSTPTTRPGTSEALTRPPTQDHGRACTPATPYFTLPNTPNNPAESGIIFINNVGQVDQAELDILYPHFKECTLGRAGQRQGSPLSRHSTPQTCTSELSLATASSVTRHITSSDTTRDIRTSQVAPWTQPRTPLNKSATPSRDLRRPGIRCAPSAKEAPLQLSPPRTPRMTNAHPPASADNSASRLKKSDALGDLFHSREGFKAGKDFLGRVQVAVDDGEQHVFWDTQSLWHVGGILILESAPLDQVVTTWQPAKRGVQGHFTNELVNEAKLSRGCQVDEMILLQERALKDKPFALDVVSAEMRATFTSKFVWKKGLTGLRAERGEELRVYRAREGGNVYGEYRGYPGVVPATAIQISRKVKKQSLTMALGSAEALGELVAKLHALAPKAALRLEPRTALLDSVGREGIAKKKSASLRSGLQSAFAAAHERMEELAAALGHEDDMLQGQADKAVLMGMPRRHVMAKDIKVVPASCKSTWDKTRTPNDSIQDEATRAQAAPDPHAAAPASPAANRRVTFVAREPPPAHHPAMPASPLSRRVHTPPSKSKFSPRRLVKFGVCGVCQKHGQCMVNVPKYCVRCALKLFNENLNKGDLREAAVACHHVHQLTRQNEQARETTVGENSALTTRDKDAGLRLEEATRLNAERDLMRAAHSGDVGKIKQLAESVDVCASVGGVEWVPNEGFLATRSALRGFTAAHYACMAFTGLEADGKKEALIQLVQMGVDPHQPADDGRLAMHIAVNDLSCLRCLIFQFKGDPEWRDGDGRTVLHHAALYGGLDCRIFLIGLCDADHTARDNFNKTPLDYSDDIAALVLKKRSLKMVCAFFKHVMVMKCFYLMKRYKKPPPHMLEFVPTEERKQNINLAARVVRRRLYQDWNAHGHPRLLKPWSSLLMHKSGGSLESEVSRLSSLEWSNALEWSWYIGHSSPQVLSPCDSPVWEYWGGGSEDFECQAADPEFDQDINMTMAEQGLSLSVSALAVHYDAKVVYQLESRPPTAQVDTMKRLRTPKDSAKRTRKPEIDLATDGSEQGAVGARAAAVESAERRADGDDKNMWGRLGSFTRALSSMSRAMSVASRSSAGAASQRDGPLAAHQSEAEEDHYFLGGPRTAGASQAGSSEAGAGVGAAAAVLRGAAILKRLRIAAPRSTAACATVPPGQSD